MAKKEKEKRAGDTASYETTRARACRASLHSSDTRVDVVATFRRHRLKTTQRVPPLEPPENQHHQQNQPPPPHPRHLPARKHASNT
uniref:Uncharacterized protein n=1 Tax=Peronospora matthiolae TaxID=2874970 RepID=A0AAV1TSJ5_9STRA